jgi:hypothetical protein
MNGFSHHRGFISRLISPDSSGTVEGSIKKISRFVSYYEKEHSISPKIMLNFGCGKELEETVAVGSSKKCEVNLVDIFSYGFNQSKFNSAIGILNNGDFKSYESHSPIYSFATEIEALQVKNIDYIFSCAVLEHLNADDIGKCLLAMKGKLAPLGMMVHEVDFSDHLTGVAAIEWKNNFFFTRMNTVYVNQLSPADILDIFRNNFDSSSYTINVYEYVNTSLNFVKVHSDLSINSQKSLVYQYRVLKRNE